MGSRNWCFTLNNYTDDDIQRLNNLVTNSNKIQYLLYGKEVGDSGTPHLQGFVTCNQKMRLVPVKNILGSNPHLESARNVNASINYCKKEGEWVEFGTRSNGQGARSDIKAFQDAVKEGMLSLKQIRELHPDIYAKYPRFCIEYIRDNYPKVVIPDHPLRQWQNHLNDILQDEPNRRSIIFVVDKIGNHGKSWFADWYQQKTGDSCQVLTPGKRSDMAYMLNPGLRVLFLDAPRAKQSDFIQYDFLEDLKNGRVFSPKYESIMKTYAPMHVVVLMNEDPDMSKLSRDRFVIINVEDFTEP
jgi:Putative viral replication protein